MFPSLVGFFLPANVGFDPAAQDAKAFLLVGMIMGWWFGGVRFISDFNLQQLTMGVLGGFVEDDPFLCGSADFITCFCHLLPFRITKPAKILGNYTQRV
jgi:hypothetical protein